METQTLVILCLLFFCAAAVYSMVGFGGASAYLAVLAFSGLPRDQIAPIALMCNLLVAGIAAGAFIHERHLRPSLVLPFMVLSVPCAYWGARTPISDRIFSLLLGISLAVAASRIFLSGHGSRTMTAHSRVRVWVLGMPAGAIIGYVSGLIGIGGGIFLSPLLILLRWADPKVAGCSAALFIVVNSLAGLAGYVARPMGASPVVYASLAVAVGLGGWFGSRTGAGPARRIQIARLLAVLMLTVAARTLWRVL
ncbi:MAG: hypothetical protein MOGMAGMI_01561 [Candidatus Omnitrophica bacterium]|nr:hypothetical protein [Candidatus Omnitrophota bacterium]